MILNNYIVRALDQSVDAKHCKQYTICDCHNVMQQKLVHNDYIIWPNRAKCV